MNGSAQMSLDLPGNRPGCVVEAVVEGAVIGGGMLHLACDPADFVAALPALGHIRAETANRIVTHVKYGAYGNVSAGPGGGIVLNQAIDLRLTFRYWRHIFAAPEGTADFGRGFHVFDASGRPVHGIVLTDSSDHAAFAALTARFADPGTEARAVPPVPQPALPPDASVDRRALAAHWAALQDTHDFVALLRDFGIGRLQALRLIGEDYARPLGIGTLERLVALAAAEQVPLMVFAGNAGCLQIHSGAVAPAGGPPLRITGPGFECSVDTAGLASLWLVRKPTRDGIVTSIEAFDDTGELVLQLFGVRKPGIAESEAWRALLQAGVGQAG